MQRICIAFAFALLGAGAASAQSRPEPADPGAAVPPLEYRSAFSEYRGGSQTKPAPWREVNEEVGRLGGHAGHVRGSRAAPRGAQGASTMPPESKGAHAHGAHGARR